jgi:SNF2 family DNA or RNA helicase
VPNLLITIENERLGKIVGKWSAHERAIVNSAPDRTRWGQTGAFLFDPTPANLSYLRMAIQGDWVDHTNILVEEAIIQAAPVLNTADLPPITDFKPKTPMFKHQEIFFAWSREKKEFAAFLDKGLGKTKALLDIIADRFQRGQINGALVLSPNGVHRQWIEEQIPLHMVEMPLITYVYSSAKYPAKDAAILRPSTDLRILSMNIEALSRGRGILAAKDFLQSGRMAIIVDESSRIRSPTATCTINTLILGKSAAMRVIASGNPVPSGLENLYTQFQFLNPQILGHGSYTSFMRHYCVLQQAYGAPRGAMEVVGYRNVADLEQRIKPFSMYAKKSDCLDLPPKMYATHYVESTPEQRRLYNQVRREFLAEINGKEVTYDNALTRIIRLQQILSGWVVEKTRQGDDILHEVLSNRIPALDEFLTTLPKGGKVIIWARFQRDIDLISKMLETTKRRFVTYVGATSAADRATAIEEFTKGNAQIFLSNPAAGGIGLNLQVAQNVIYYTNGRNPEHREQSEDRCHRIGTTGTVTYTDFMVPSSIDAVILEGLRTHADVAKMIMENGPHMLKELT